MANIKEEAAIHQDGWSGWIYPIMEGYKFCCCDCGLVHEMEFRVSSDYDRVEFRVRRDNRSTGQIRRHMALNNEAYRAGFQAGRKTALKAENKRLREALCEMIDFFGQEHVTDKWDALISKADAALKQGDE